MRDGEILADAHFVRVWIDPDEPPRVRRFFDGLAGRPIAMLEDGLTSLTGMMHLDGSIAKNASREETRRKAEALERFDFRIVPGFGAATVAERIAYGNEVGLRPEEAELVFAARRDYLPLATFSNEIKAYAKRTGLPLVTI